MPNSSNDIIKNCDWISELSFANSNIDYIVSTNPKIKPDEDKLFPLTQSYLQNYYYKTDYGNTKNSYSDGNCAADAFSYWLSSYGNLDDSGNANLADTFNQGLLPFGLPWIGGFPRWFQNLFWLAIAIIIFIFIKKLFK